ncbi:hypothetical protein SCUP515_04850 [Seiridium cupressi]
MATSNTKRVPGWERPSPYEHLTSGRNFYDQDQSSFNSSRSDLSTTTYKSVPPVLNVKPALREDLTARDTHISDHEFSWESKILDRALLLSASALPLAASTFLLAITITDRRWVSGLLLFALIDRASAQIVVSITSAILASLNVYAATKLLNIATRIHLLQRSLSLNMLKLIGAVATRQVATGLPIVMYATSLVTILLFSVPNFLWIGALTPVATNTTLLVPGILKIPQYSTSSNSTWSANKKTGSDCSTVTNERGTWSGCPASTMQSTLLSRAALASSNVSQIHSKHDNGLYSYLGRSYGVGSPAGIIDDNLFRMGDGSEVMSYNYVEPGYLSQISCNYNATSDWHLEMVQRGKAGNGIPSVYYAIGEFPTAPPGKVDFFSVVSLSNEDKSLAVMAAKYYADRHLVLIAAGSDYNVLNGTQCEINFTRADFSVTVDAVSKQISVLPVPGESSFDPTNGVAESVTDQINALAMITTSLYISIVGDAFVANIAAVTEDPNASVAAPTEESLSASADSLSAMVDDLLLFIGSSQFFVSNNGSGDFSAVDAQLTVQAVRLGDPTYVYLIFTTCSLLLAIVFMEAYRTKCWTYLPRWDFKDTTSLILSSAIAGEEIVGGLYPNGRGRHLHWTGGEQWSESTANSPGFLVERAKEDLPEVRLWLGKKTVLLPPGVDDKGLSRKGELVAVSLRTCYAADVAALP